MISNLGSAMALLARLRQGEPVSDDDVAAAAILLGALGAGPVPACERVVAMVGGHELLCTLPAGHGGARCEFRVTRPGHAAPRAASAVRTPPAVGTASGTASGGVAGGGASGGVAGGRSVVVSAPLRVTGGGW